MTNVSEYLSWTLTKIVKLIESTKDFKNVLLRITGINFFPVIGRNTGSLIIECSMTEEAGWRFGEHIHFTVWDQ